MVGSWVQNTKKQLREISTPKNLFDCVSNVNLHKSFDPHVLQVLLAGAFQVGFFARYSNYGMVLNGSFVRQVFNHGMLLNDR